MHHRLGFDGKGSNVGISEQGATQNTGFAEARKQGEVARTLEEDRGTPLPGEDPLLHPIGGIGDVTGGQAQWVHRGTVFQGFLDIGSTLEEQDSRDFVWVHCGMREREECQLDLRSKIALLR